MELKVWVDGIQRVVCGVSETTTCQDVVYALAHATGQTGRFTLAEKWRNNERLLAPHENPLKVLVKWGEHSSDVQFVLRRSQPGSQKNAAPPAGGSKRQHDFLHSFSPTPPNAPLSPPQQNKEIKKSLTFSGGHHSASESPTNNSAAPKPEVPVPSSQWERKEGRSKQDVPRGIVRGVPQQHPRPAEPSRSDLPPSKQKSERPRHPPSYDEAVSRSNRHAPPSHNVPPAIYTADHDSPSSKRRHLAGSRVNQVTVQESRSSPSRNKDEVQVSTEARVTSPQYSNYHGSQQDSPLTRSPEKLTPNKAPPAKTSQSGDDLFHDPQYRDLIRLVNLQREKLTNQNAELSQYDSEIVYWENRLQEQEDRLSALEEELHRLEQASTQQGGGDELLQVEELERGRQEERTLRTRLSLTRTQLQGCESDLLQRRQSLHHLSEEVEDERRRADRKQEKEEVEIEEAKEELKKQNEQLESQKSAVGEVEKDLQRLETDLSEKQKLADKLVEELREENLQSLSMAITDDIKIVAEGNFHNRPGSTRRILGSPRQLENAVPTSKNPHGVWV